METNRNRLAVVFPGIGYHCDKPLLYYGKMLARAAGYGVIEVPYGGFQKGIKGDPLRMRQAFEEALEQAERLLQGTDLASCKDVLFLSKSIGTAVAAAYAEKDGISARHIYFTPVEASFRFMKGEGIVFHGTADPWAATETVTEGCRRLGLPLYVTEGANHSMETGDVVRDLETMSEIMGQCGAFIAGSRR